ncbi:MAG: hypothetical protein CVU44_06820 [Chloroflexi bacterium HGW-Chloroflexi-6]|nr:MAG: hypothetical protein CVU44_06820 [Chloroflexi bacterium HGW-Chloroflexi-6]
MIFENSALDLAIALAPYPLTGDFLARAEARLSYSVDWTDFLFWVKRHGIGGMVLANMHVLGEKQFPQDVFQQLKRFQYQSGLHNMKLLSELAKLNTLLASNQIRFIPLKGPLFSHLLYNSFNLRASFDLDLLVSAADFPCADALLRQAGYVCYEPSFALTPLQARLYAQYRHHYSYRHPEQGIAVELHWSLAEPYYLSSELSEQWMRRSIQEQVPGLTVSILSYEDMLVYTLVHGAKHRWSSVKLLLDLLAILRLPHEFDWQLVENSLRLTRLGRVAAQGVALLQELWGFDVPEPLNQLARPDAASRFLTRFSLDTLSWPQTEKREDPRWFGYGFLLKPGFAYQAHYISKILTSPLIERAKRSKAKL